MPRTIERTETITETARATRTKGHSKFNLRETEDDERSLLEIHLEIHPVEARDVYELLAGLESLLNATAREILQQENVPEDQWPEGDLIEIEVLRMSVSSFKGVVRVTAKKLNALIKHPVISGLVVGALTHLADAHYPDPKIPPGPLQPPPGITAPAVPGKPPPTLPPTSGSKSGQAHHAHGRSARSHTHQKGHAEYRPPQSEAEQLLHNLERSGKPFVLSLRETKTHKHIVIDVTRRPGN